MPKKSTLIDESLVKKAQIALEQLGNSGISANRLRAIIASHKHGIKKVVEVYDITRASLHRWVKLFKAGEDLKNAKKPARSKINESQKAIIRGLIESDSGITIKKLKITIKQEFDIDISKSSVHRLIQELGFRHITGRKAHYKSDPLKQEEFKKKSTGTKK